MSKHISTLLVCALFATLYALPGCAYQSKEHGDEHSAGHGDEGADGHAATHAHADSYSVGEPADVADVERSIVVVMSDAMTYTFTPKLTTINNGEVINFVVRNDGKINHEFSIGNQEDQVEHAAMMAKMSNMVHDDPNTVTVKPGESKSIAWRFQGDDLVVFACNIPGHYQAGMFKKSAIVDAHEEDGHADHPH